MQSFSVSKCLFICGFSLFLQAQCPGVNADDPLVRVYYSIHLASFKDFGNANAFVNTLKKKEEIVFWREVDVPGKGLFYRVYLGRYRDKIEALRFCKELKKNGSVSYCGIHRFREAIEKFAKEKPGDKAVEKKPVKVKALKPKEPGVKAVKKKPVKAKAFLPVSGKDRFVDNHDGTVTDRLTNLMWVKNGWRMDLMSSVTWQEAREKCRDFRLGDYDNWRLPTIEEWRSVIDNSKEYPALVEPNSFVNIIAHMPYWSGSEFVFGKEHTCIKVCPVQAYTVMLYFGSIRHQNKAKRAFVLPVRTID